ncbi:serine/threonine-protein kinase [Allostreptomyces psammosilenae]|uniref:non-specific serine/threonine protein kinase n=1 Tax=Allostreptomyces psammosilenae TaxID=1892865 RepID=A0A853ACU9_9ACTN|nr:protein kinase [Allostreptomyces psammosilenae]NYI08268.1 serine/threonine protein kinase [Allostreptomyces psammosilenae]
MTRPGRLVAGRYRLGEAIGRGGMGEVWVAYDEALDRRVAVKLMRSELLSGRGDHGTEVRRFARECRTAAQIDHPGLVTVYDAGEDRPTDDPTASGGQLYLVMQLVDGISLGDFIAETDPMPCEWAVAVAAQLLGVLAAIHAVSVVHRDLKPSNVMVRRDGTVRLLDLGIVAVLSDAATKLTRTGAAPGSPSYMAPEQAYSTTVDRRTDLYALGCLLHEMLTGQAPFRAPTAYALVAMHRATPPTPVRQLRPEVPEALERLVLDLLAKEPDARPADAHEVYRRLAPLLPAADPALPVPPLGFGMPDPTRPFRFPLAPVLSAPAAPTGTPWAPEGTGSGQAALVPSTRPFDARLFPALSTPATPATTPPAAHGHSTPPGDTTPPRHGTTPGQAAEPGQTAAFGRTAPAGPGDPGATGAFPATALSFPAVTGPAPVPPGRPPSAPAGAGQLDLTQVGRDVSRMLDEGRYTQAVDLLARVLPEAAARHGDDARVVRTLRHHYAATLQMDAQYGAALREFRHLARQAEAEGGPESVAALEYRAEAASCLEELGEPAAALAEYRTVLPLLQRHPDADPEQLLTLRRRIGDLLAHQRDFRGAWDVLAPLLPELERRYGPHDDEVVALRHTLDSLQAAAGDPQTGPQYLGPQHSAQQHTGAHQTGHPHTDPRQPGGSWPGTAGGGWYPR